MALMQRNDSGFTIVESLIALVILMVGLLALSMLHITAARANNLGRGRTLATILAYEQIERFQRLGYDNIATGNNEATLDGRHFSRSWTSTDNGNSKTVVVNIAWADQWGNHTVKVPAVVRP